MPSVHTTHLSYRDMVLIGSRTIADISIHTATTASFHSIHIINMGPGIV